MDGKTYALKEFKLASEVGLKELMREAAVLRRVRHPAIVEVLGVFEDTANKTMLLQMSFFEHGTLQTWVDTEAPEWRAVRSVLLDIAGALEHLHAAGVVHCDVKPPNILVAPFFRGRLADFDISVDSATRTSTNFAATRVQYTAGFDAPELHK
jgi:serine/threonine protein kinase